jgi:YgiT-type zinc finger domain-containing protein
MQRRNELRVVKEAMIETEVTYTVELGGRFYLVEHVPARVCQETGEQCFSPETVERIQALIKGGKKPARVVETPVYEYT